MNELLTIISLFISVLVCCAFADQLWPAQRNKPKALPSLEHYSGLYTDVFPSGPYVMNRGGSLTISVTKCPQRVDGARLGVNEGGFCDAMIEEPQTKWLIDHCFLSPYKCFTPESAIDITERCETPHTDGEINFEDRE